MAKAQRKTAVATVTKTATAVETEKKGRKEVQPIVLNKSQEKNLNECQTTSAKIRLLNAEGFENGQIAKFLAIRYQHVRNVLTTPMKRKAKASA